MRAEDWYCSFAALSERESEGVDFRICSQERESDVLIMAPHGGCIEPVTSRIALTIAEEDFSVYCFESLKNRPHHEMHITSHKFDEPQALNIARRASVIVAIHGRGDREDCRTVWLGGLDNTLIERIANELRCAGFQVFHQTGALAGRDANNICNRSSRGCGVQIELPRALRTRLDKDNQLLSKFSGSVRAAILGVE